MSDIFSHESLERLQYASELRRQIIDKVVGRDLPGRDNLEVADFVMGALKDLEDVEIKMARVRASDKEANASQSNAAMMAELMKHVMNSSSIQYVEDTDEDDLILPDDMEFDLIEGEADIHQRAITLEELMSSEELLEIEPDTEDEEPV